MLVLPLGIVRVRGRSMLPTYADGDLLLVTSRFVPRAGRAVILDLPPDRHGAPRPRSVKRLTHQEPTQPPTWWIDSDNPGEGVTSFDVGAVPESAIVGLVLLRLPSTLARLLGE